MADAMAYPWYELAEGDRIEQGDLFPQRPAFLPVSGLALISLGGEFDLPDPLLDIEYRDMAVLTQSCDMVMGQVCVESVVLCAAYPLDKVSLGKDKVEAIRKGNNPKAHLLPPCEIAGAESALRIADFTRVSTLPLEFLRRRAQSSGPRVRLLPPYRESLSQAFGRFMMRVAIPDGMDVPPIK